MGRIYYAPFDNIAVTTDPDQPAAGGGQGADPGQIPVEVNNTIELVINLKVAKELGITVPPEVLYQADRIIR